MNGEPTFQGNLKGSFCSKEPAARATGTWARNVIAQLRPSIVRAG